MIEILPLILSLVIATFIAYFELVTTTYPRTGFLLRNCLKLYIYSFIYGLISLGLMLAWKSLIANEVVQVKGIVIENVWAQAVFIGVSTKALLNINLFTVGHGESKMPIGIKTILQLFEPWFLREIDLFHFSSLQGYLKPFSDSFSEIEPVKKKIKDNIPPKFPGQEKNAFIKDLDDAQNTNSALDLYLNFAGRNNFERVFHQ